MVVRNVWRATDPSRWKKAAIRGNRDLVHSPPKNRGALGVPGVSKIGVADPVGDKKARAGELLKNSAVPPGLSQVYCTFLSA